MSLINPLSGPSMHSQGLTWNEFEINIEYQFELITPLKAEARPFKDGGYIRYVAEALNTTAKFNQNDILLIEFPLKTFDNGLLSISLANKKKIMDLNSNNLIIFFRKTNKGMNGGNMQITFVESRLPSITHLEWADKFYPHHEKKQTINTSESY
jgi:hypothetical protein